MNDRRLVIIGWASIIAIVVICLLNAHMVRIHARQIAQRELLISESPNSAKIAVAKLWPFLTRILTCRGGLRLSALKCAENIGQAQTFQCRQIHAYTPAPGKTDPNEIKSIIDSEVRKPLNELSQYDPRDYYPALENRPGSTTIPSRNFRGLD